MTGPRRGLTRRGMTRRGMTLIETLVAIVILASVLIGLGEFMAQFAHTTKVSALQQRGLDLATDRIDSVEHSQTMRRSTPWPRSRPSRCRLDGVPAQTTYVQHIGGGPTDTMDYRTVTVSVAMPTVTAPVRKTTIIAAF